MQAEETVEVTLGKHAPVKTLELPVPDIPGRRLPLADDTFGAGAAGVVHGSQVTVAWRADAEGSAVEVWPLELAEDRMPNQGSKLRIQTPFAVLPNCVAVSTDNKTVVVDLITDVGILYTVFLQAIYLVDSEAVVPTPATLSRSSRPYNFDATPPRLMKAVDTLTLVVALADGTLTRIDRAAPLSNPSYTSFTEDYSSGIGAGLARVFRAGADRVPGRPDLALRTALSIDVINHNIVTYAVDGSLRLWSLDSNSCVQVIPAPPNTALRTLPASLLAAQGDRVVVAQSSELQFYQLQGNSLKKVDDATTAIAPELRSWFSTGLVLRADFSVMIAFKTNLSARVFVIHKKQWTQIGSYDLASLLDLPADSSIQHASARVLQSSDSVLRAALQQLVPDQAEALHRAPLTDSLVRDIVLKLASGSDERTQWLRLDTLCREIEVADAELLAVAATSEAPESLGWTIRASSFTLLSSDLGSELENSSDSRFEALDVAHDLLKLVPESTLEKISTRILSSDMLLDRVDDACELVRPYLDSTQLNEIGRRQSKQLAAAIARYAQAYAPGAIASAAVPKKSIKLSGLGSLAVTELVRNYAIQQSRSFLLLAILSVIGLVEGWFADDGNAEPFRGTLACHQRLAFVAALESTHLQPEINSAQLGHFGLQAARELTAKIDPLSIMASMLPESSHERNHGIYARFNTMASIIESSVSAAELTTLRGLAALAAHEERHGEELLRRVSLAQKWPGALAPVPTTSAAWFARVACYAKQVGARDTALRFARTGSVLSTSSRENASDEGTNEVLSMLFELSLEAGEISTAYTALVRRYAQNPEGSEEWLTSFIDSLARKDPEGAAKLIATLPFVGLTAQLTRVLKNVQVFGSIPSYKLRYAWYIEHEDYAGAALSVYEHIKRDPGDAVRKNALYTICLNALALQKQDSRWVIYGNRVVTFEDIRGEYSALLENMAKTASAY